MVPLHNPIKSTAYFSATAEHLELKVQGLQAALVGIEPTHPGFKVPRLTAWLQGYISLTKL